MVCRVAPSFLRFGNFELRRRAAIPSCGATGRLLHPPRLPPHRGRADQRARTWFAQVCERTATMVAHWMRVGFVHGVMNTDNMSILVSPSITPTAGSTIRPGLDAQHHRCAGPPLPVRPAAGGVLEPGALAVPCRRCSTLSKAARGPAGFNRYLARRRRENIVGKLGLCRVPRRRRCLDAGPAGVVAAVRST